jgi:hypothetical protein
MMNEPKTAIGVPSRAMKILTGLVLGRDADSLHGGLEGHAMYGGHAVYSDAV